MQIQHVKIALPFESGNELDADGFIRVFHAWIQQGLFDEILIDVADYRHVDRGPEVLLIGHEADTGIERHGGRRWLFYSRKKVIEGDGRAALAQALAAVLERCERLEAEERFAGKLTCSRREFEVTINDRALAPNSAEAFGELEPQVRALIGDVAGSGDISLEHASAADPRDLLRVAVRCEAALDTARARQAAS